MKKLYILSPEQTAALETLMDRVIGTKAVPEVPCRYSWIVDALEDNKASKFRKFVARVLRKTHNTPHIPDYGDMLNAFCYCGREADWSMDCGECIGCHTGVTDLIEAEDGFIGFHGPFKTTSTTDYLLATGMIDEADIESIIEDAEQDFFYEEEEGPYGGAFSSMEDYARHVGINLK